MTHPSVSRKWLGSIFALLSAAAFALNLVLAGVSYQFGANVHALNLTRAATFLICLIFFVLIRRQSLALPMLSRLSCFWIGVLLCIEMYALLSALRTIPVAMAVLVFYTYPILIAVYRWGKGSEPFSMIKFALLMLAVAGLTLVLIDSDLRSSYTGIGLAMIGALAMAAMLIASERNLTNYDNDVVMLHALAAVTVIIIILSSTVVALAWPDARVGWIYFSASSVFYVFATMLLFRAVSLIGPLNTAIIDNTSPIWAILFGYLLLQQSLSGQQMIGAAIVVIAVMLLQTRNRELSSSTTSL